MLLGSLVFCIFWQFDCIAPTHKISPLSGYPSPVIQWQKDDRILDIDNERVIVKGYELIINSVIETDGGTYSCIATNDAGTALAETGQCTVQITRGSRV